MLEVHTSMHLAIVLKKNQKEIYQILWALVITMRVYVRLTCLVSNEYNSSCGVLRAKL